VEESPILRTLAGPSNAGTNSVILDISVKSRFKIDCRVFEYSYFPRYFTAIDAEHTIIYDVEKGAVRVGRSSGDIQNI
jgi:hypothetical protein